MVRNLWHYRQFIFRGAGADLRERYLGSVGGAAWHIVNPIAQVALFSVVFSRVMPLRLPALGDSLLSFPLYLCAGVMPWQAFCDTLTRCTASFHANAHYLRKLPTPEQVFVARDAVTSTLGLCVSMVVLLAFSVIVRGRPDASLLQVPVLVLGFQAFAFGLGLFLGVINVFLRDVEHVLPVVLTVWFWTTPIAYVVDILPAWSRPWLDLNPLWPFVQAFRATVVEGRWVDGATMAACLGAAVVSCTLGYLTLRHFRWEIRDVL